MRAVLVLLAACYGAPDYTGTGFRCDADHGCPDGQQCIAGVCTASGSGSNGSGFDGIKCGVGGTCGAGMECCADQAHPYHCVPVGQQCLGEYATCDGVEDCTNGQKCCDTGTPTACAASCAAYACTDTTDCPSNAPMCCFINPTVPWGRCEPVC